MTKQLADDEPMRDLLNHTESVDIRSNHSYSFEDSGGALSSSLTAQAAGATDEHESVSVLLRRSQTLPTDFATDLHKFKKGNNNDEDKLEYASLSGDWLCGVNGSGASTPNSGGAGSHRTLDWSHSPCSHDSCNSIATFTFSNYSDGGSNYEAISSTSSESEKQHETTQLDNCVISATVNALLLADLFWVSSYEAKIYTADRGVVVNVSHPRQNIIRGRWFVPDKMIERTGLWTNVERTNVDGYTYHSNSIGIESGLYPCNKSIDVVAVCLSHPELVRSAVTTIASKGSQKDHVLTDIETTRSQANKAQTIQSRTKYLSNNSIEFTQRTAIVEDCKVSLENTQVSPCEQSNNLGKHTTPVTKHAVNLGETKVSVSNARGPPCELSILTAEELQEAVKIQVGLMEEVMKDSAVKPCEGLSSLMHRSLMLPALASSPSSPASVSSEEDDAESDSSSASIASAASSFVDSDSDDSNDGDNSHDDEGEEETEDEHEEEEEEEEEQQQQQQHAQHQEKEEVAVETQSEAPTTPMDESEAVAMALPHAPLVPSVGSFAMLAVNHNSSSSSSSSANNDNNNNKNKNKNKNNNTTSSPFVQTKNKVTTAQQSDEALENARGTHIHALAKELRKLPKQVCVSCSEGSMFVRFDPEAPYLLRCCLTGVSGSPYSYGVFVFDIKCPPDYPTSPPQVLHVTQGSQSIQAPHSPGGFSPNMHWDSGKVCLSLLGTWDGPGWLADKSNLYQVMSTILLMILAAPDPYVMEPGHGGWEGDDYFDEDGDEQVDIVSECESNIADAVMYKYQVCAATARHAILETLRSPPVGFEEVVEAHLCVSQREILAQVRRWAADAKAAGQDDSALVLRECLDELETEFPKHAAEELTNVLMERERRSLIELKGLLLREQQRVLDDLANTDSWESNLGLHAKTRLCKISTALENTKLQLRYVTTTPVTQTQHACELSYGVPDSTAVVAATTSPTAAA